MAKHTKEGMLGKRFVYGCLWGATLALSGTFPASSANEDNPSLMVVDTPGLLRVAIAAAYRDNPEINAGGLAVEYPIISVNCRSDPHWLPVDPQTLQCPAQPSQLFQCRARIQFVILNSVKRDVIARQDGYCQVHTEQESIDVTVYPDGFATTSRSSGSGSSSHSNCDSESSFLEVDTLVQQYEKALAQELGE